MLHSSDWTASDGIQYEVQEQAIGGLISLRLDWLYQSSATYSGPRKDIDQHGYSTFTGCIIYHTIERGAEISRGATKLLDEFHGRDLFAYTEGGNASLNGQPSPPREWGLTVSKDF